jgi:hypothetical protein
MPALLETPFWLNQRDPHRIAAVMQFLTRPREQATEIACYFS